MQTQLQPNPNGHYDFILHQQQKLFPIQCHYRHYVNFSSLYHFFLVRLMCAIRAHINKYIFEKVLLGQFSINFLQNWFYYYVPSHISKIAFFFPVIFPIVPIIANQSTKNKQSNTTLIYYLISTNSTLSLSIINIREL